MAHLEERSGERGNGYLIAGFLAVIIGFAVLTLGILSDDALLFEVGAGIMCVAAIIQCLLFLTQRYSRKEIIPFNPEKKEPSAIIYEDRLVSITNESITFFSYSFPLGESRRVFFRDIEHITATKPTVFNGKWRIWGSGNLRTWFPLDIRRPSRDMIFVATLKTKGFSIGFSVEDSQKAIDFFRIHRLLLTEN